MSIAQMKKRYAELEAYLGKDKEGIKRLKLYKDEVNELRTSLAAAEDALQLAQTIKDAARERADTAEASLEELQIETYSLRQQVGSLMRDLDTVTRVEEPVEKIKLPRDEDAEIRAVVRALRKQVRVCPAGKCIDTRDDRLVRFCREDIAAGWTHSSLWALGASVALLVELLGKVVIVTKRSDRPTTARDSSHASQVRHVLDWYAPNNLDAYEDLADQMYDVICLSNQRRLKHDE